jgi:hypothetical protein
MPIAIVAAVSPFDFVALVTQVIGEFRFQYLLQGLSKQAGKDAFSNGYIMFLTNTKILLGGRECLFSPQQER